jgi:hypothetical protein
MYAIEDSIVSFNGLVEKDQILNKFAFEREYCKKHHQPTLWTYYNYNNRRMEFADKKAQFRAINELWKAQGWNFTKQTQKPELAKLIGARSVIGHVYQNPNRNESNSESYTEPLSTMMGYMNAGNEVVTWEINW